MNPVGLTQAHDLEYTRYGIPHFSCVRKPAETLFPTRQTIVAPAILFILMIVLPIAISYTRVQTDSSLPDGTDVLIVDDLGLPNEYRMPTSITDLIKSSRTQVEYVSGLTIEQFSSLASLDYRLIILRVHSGPDAISMDQKYTSSAYVPQQLRNEVSAFRLDSGTIAFTVTPMFVQNDMNGIFRHRAIIMIEGCGALGDAGLAQAFLGRGAAALVGWDKPVTLSQADQVTERVLEKFLLYGRTLGNSVSESMRELGPDPLTGASLKYYPPSAYSVSYDYT